MIGSLLTSCSHYYAVGGNETSNCDPKVRQDCHTVSLAYIQKSEDLRNENVRLKDALNVCRRKGLTP